MTKKIDITIESNNVIIQIKKTFSDLGIVFEKNEKIDLTNNKKMLDYFKQKQIQGFVDFINI